MSLWKNKQYQYHFVLTEIYKNKKDSFGINEQNFKNSRESRFKWTLFTIRNSTCNTIHFWSISRRTHRSEKNNICDNYNKALDLTKHLKIFAECQEDVKAFKVFPASNYIFKKNSWINTYWNKIWNVNLLI